MKATRQSAAVRMRRYRARQKAAGLTERRAWVRDDAASPQVYSNHRLHEIRSLALHALVARRLQRDPKLLGVARRNLERWLSAHPDAAPYHEWREIMRRPLPEILAIMTASTPRAERLRQSTPFVGILDATERERIFAALRP